MHLKPPWILAAMGIGVSGFFVTQSLHTNFADQVSHEEPGSVVVSYYQPNPGLGKLVSIASSIGISICLWVGVQAKDDKSTSDTIPQDLSTQKSVAISSEEVLPPKSLNEEDTHERNDSKYPSEQRSVTKGENLTKQTIVKNPIDLIADCSRKKRHFFIACQTQTGKTSTVLKAIERRTELLKGEINWTIFDPKHSVWMGLEDVTNPDGKSAVTTLRYDSPRDILEVLSRMDWALQDMTKRELQRKAATLKGLEYNPRPHVYIFDEWISLRKLADIFDEDEAAKERDPKEQKPESAWKRIKRIFELLVLNGLEDGISVWIVSQMPDLKQVGIDTGLRDQFAYWCQGRDGDNRSIEAALGNNWIVPGAVAAKLRSQVAEMEQLDQDVPIIYTNISGHKILRHQSIIEIKQKRIFGNSQNVLQFPNHEEASDMWA